MRDLKQIARFPRMAFRNMVLRTRRHLRESGVRPEAGDVRMALILLANCATWEDRVDEASKRAWEAAFTKGARKAASMKSKELDEMCFDAALYLAMAEGKGLDGEDLGFRMPVKRSVRLIATVGCVLRAAMTGAI